MKAAIKFIFFLQFLTTIKGTIALKSCERMSHWRGCKWSHLAISTQFLQFIPLRHSFLMLTNLTCEYWHCPITFFSFSVYISKFFSLFLMKVIVLKKYILIWLNVWRDSWKVTNNRWEIHPQIYHFISFLLLFHRC